ncbi:MAG TPA: exonuclease domain-containing protein [Bacteroidales bacterium]|nr:exonuclease domain-containing protein [Bacteroidales bacterium]
MKLQLQKPIAFFDLETTGTNLTEDRIVEISVLRIDAEGNETTLTERFNPGIPIPPFATAIHGISDEDVKDKPFFKERASYIWGFMKQCDLSGYNALRFDIPFLAEELLRAEITIDIRQHRVIDVQNIFHKMEPRNLVAAYKYYCNKELVNAHSAEADTRATYEVLLAQLDRYQHETIKDANGKLYTPVQNDVDALHKFSYYSKFVDLAGHIVYDDKNVEIFNFGKYKGRSVSKVFKDEPSYYDWMMKSQFPLYTKKVIERIYLSGINKGNNTLNL